MPYKKKFKLPGPTWDTFIKKNFSQFFIFLNFFIFFLGIV